MSDSSTLPAPSKYLESVHLLRGIAALLVVIHHSIGWYPLPLLGSAMVLLDAHGELGQLGVAVFFVISGFVLPLSLDGDYTARCFPKFLAKRIIRIEPTYVASVVFAAGILFAKTRLAPHGEPWIPDLGQMAAHLLYVIPLTHYQWVNDVYWTLAIEFQYYILIGLLFPVFRWASSRSQFLMGGCVVAFASLVLLADSAPQIGLLRQAPYFAMGLLAFDVFRNPQRFRLALPLSIGLVGLGCWQELKLLHMLVALVSGTLILYWRPMLYSWRWLGTISYSLYVIHYPLTTVINQSAVRVFSGPADWVLYFVPFIGIAFSLAVAWLLYHYVESPTQRLSKVIQYRVKPGGPSEGISKLSIS